MALELITTHAADALARLTQTLKGKPNLEALLTALAAEPQALENALYSLYSERTIDAAVGVQLDVIGTIVGQERESSADDDAYRLRLKARVKSNKSSGTVSEILDVFISLLGVPDGLRIEPQYPAAFILHLEDMSVADVETALLYVDFLGDAKAAGVRASLQFTYDHEATLTCPATCFLTTDADAPGGDGPFIIDVYPSTEGFPDSGSFIVSIDEAEEETLNYTSKTETTFTVLEWFENHGADSLVINYTAGTDQHLSSTATPGVGGVLASIIDA
jgi:hypothetical protein